MAIPKSRLGRGLGNLIAGGISSGAKPSAPAPKPAPAKKAAPAQKSAPAKGKPAPKPAIKATVQAKAPAQKSQPVKPAQKASAQKTKPATAKQSTPAKQPVKAAVQTKLPPKAAVPAKAAPAAKPSLSVNTPAAKSAPTPAPVAKPAPIHSVPTPVVKPTASASTIAHSAHVPQVTKPEVTSAAASAAATSIAAAQIPANDTDAPASDATAHAVSTADQAKPATTISAAHIQPATPAAHVQPAAASAPLAGSAAAASAPVVRPTATASAALSPAAAALPASPYREISVSVVVPNPYQPRRDMDAEHIAELANSIASEGLLQPIVVRPLDGGKGYELIAGERRWRAHQKLGLRTIAARVMDASDSSSAVISLIENIQRQALNPIEEALGFASLMRDFDLTQEAVSERIGRARASIANSLRLLALDREIQGYVSKGILSVGHAKILLGLEEPAQRVLIARRIIEGGLSVRETEVLVKRLKSDKHARPGGSGSANISEADRTAITDLEKQLSSRLNTKVQLRHTPKKGRIVIEYYGNEDLQRILERTGLQL